MMSVTAECIKGGDVAAVPAILLPLLYANMRDGQRARPGILKSWPTVITGPLPLLLPLPHPLTTFSHLFKQVN